MNTTILRLFQESFEFNNEHMKKSFYFTTRNYSFFQSVGESNSDNTVDASVISDLKTECVVSKFQHEIIKKGISSFANTKELLAQ